MFTLSIGNPHHVRRYGVHPSTDSGWVVRIEQDRSVARQDHYRDWHHVERAIAAVQREVTELTADGWTVER